jgi:hypothetical protein
MSRVEPRVRRTRKGTDMTHRIAAPLVRVFGRRDEQGMTTAEYAVGTVSACSFAGILYKILTTGFGEKLLEGLLDKVMDILPF